MSAAKAQIPNYGEGMNEEWLAYVMQQTMRGLDYLHQKGHIHRDIKGGNILLDSSGGVRLADFGVAGWTISKGLRNDTVKTFVGTPAWMAPEVLEQSDGYDNKADIWSLGITALELAKGTAPYAHFTPMRILVLTIEDEPASLHSYKDDKQRTGAPFSRLFEDFYKKCLQKNSKARPSTSELLKHKFLQKRSPETLVNNLLNHIDAVGTSSSKDLASKAVLDSIEEFADLCMDATISRARCSAAPILETVQNPDNIKGKKFTAGTTWTFDTDEPGLAIQQTEITRAAQLNDFLDDFETEVIGPECREGLVDNSRHSDEINMSENF